MTPMELKLELERLANDLEPIAARSFQTTMLINNLPTILRALSALSACEGAKVEPSEEFAAVLQYFAQRSDADQPSGCASPIPNEAMRHLTTLSLVHDAMTAAEVALKPFADAASKADKESADAVSHSMGPFSDNMSPGWGIKYSHVKFARSALAQLQKVMG